MDRLKFIKMKYPFLILVFTVLVHWNSLAQEESLFSYFTGNGEDGLHLAYSHDGLTWETLNDNLKE